MSTPYIHKPYIVNGKECLQTPWIILGENEHYAIVFMPDKYYPFDICHKEKDGSYTSKENCFSLFNKKIYQYFSKDDITKIIGNICTNMLKVFKTL